MITMRGNHHSNALTLLLQHRRFRDVERGNICHSFFFCAAQFLLASLTQPAARSTETAPPPTEEERSKRSHTPTFRP